MLSVLREIGANMTHGVIQKADFKIVYVAPMKVCACACVCMAHTVCLRQCF